MRQCNAGPRVIAIIRVAGQHWFHFFLRFSGAEIATPHD
jgi:hypothetical protein